MALWFSAHGACRQHAPCFCLFCLFFFSAVPSFPEWGDSAFVKQFEMFGEKFCLRACVCDSVLLTLQPELLADPRNQSYLPMQVPCLSETRS